MTTRTCGLRDRLLAPLIGAALALAPLATAAAQPPIMDFSKEAAKDPSKFIIEVEVPTPQVGYVLTRQELEDLETLQLKGDFVPKIVRSVDSSVF